MPSRFARDTAVFALGDGRYEGRIDPAWWIMVGPNGGYVAAILLRAVMAELGSRDDTGSVPRPRSATFHFLRRPAEGAVEIHIAVEREGRSITNVSARMTQGDDVLVLALVALGSARDTPVVVDEDPGFPAEAGGAAIKRPSLLPPDEIDPHRSVPIRDNYDMRWVLGAHPFEPGPPEGRTARCGGWIRLSDPEPVDEVVLTAVSDAWLPPLFSRVVDQVAVPTIDLTVHFRSLPSPGLSVDGDWLFIEVASPVVAEGFLVEHGRILDADGRLLAESRQLAVVA